MDQDVIIVGAGPAGIACGIMLQKCGVPSLILERQVFPREKLCGGLVTEKTYALVRGLFGGEPPAQLFTAIRKVALWDRTERIACTELGTTLRITDRKAFDDALLQQYLALGGRIRQGEAVRQLRAEAHVVVTDQGEYSYRYLVAADGCSSVLRRLCGKTLKDVGFCLETTAPLDALRTDADCVHVLFRYLRGGYSWIFPCRDSCKVGVGNNPSRRTPYRESLDALRADFCTGSGTPVKGACVPYGSCLKDPVYGDSVFFVGDAAGTADPLYGEGLYFACRSGMDAAAAIAGAAEGGAEKEYRERYAEIRTIIRRSRRIRKLLLTESGMKLLRRTCRKHPGAVRFFVDRQVSYYSFRGLLSAALAYRRRKRDGG